MLKCGARSRRWLLVTVLEWLEFPPERGQTNFRKCQVGSLLRVKWSEADGLGAPFIMK